MKAEQIKSLIKYFGEADEERFFSSALQIAAMEARKGHTNFAQELKTLIEKAQKNRSFGFTDRAQTIPILQPKRELKDLMDIFHPRIQLKDMVLQQDIRQTLDKLIKEQQHWEALQKYNLMPRRKLLLIGPPGCGKTMTAQALAGELGIPAFIVRLDGLVSKFMGESIAKLRLIFEAMVDNRGVYLFDEFDSIGSHRDQGQDVGEIKRILNSFLIHIEKDQSNSIIIAATNMPEMLDKALFRRFDEVMVYPLPEKAEIMGIIKNSLQGFSFDKEPDYFQLAEIAKGLNFSDVVKACEETIKEMILKGADKLSLSDIEYALKRKSK